ncbi:unnamed protein product [Thelazia callipaeda]|uniref:Secreted protein n=1 Tax=Thelazia callipaeda TaxID=103827 RepID=A0A0N5D2W5_THECL|nr:unnamed protein product [Thelazia callipaeda]
MELKLNEMSHLTNFLLGSLLLHFEIAKSHCSYRINEAIQRCVQPVAQYAKILNQQLHANRVKNITAV